MRIWERERERDHLQLVRVEKCGTLQTERKPAGRKLRKWEKGRSKITLGIGKKRATQGLVVDAEWFDLYVRKKAIQGF